MFWRGRSISPHQKSLHFFALQTPLVPESSLDPRSLDAHGFPEIFPRYRPSHSNEYAPFEHHRKLPYTLPSARWLCAVINRAVRLDQFVPGALRKFFVALVEKQVPGKSFSNCLR